MKAPDPPRRTFLAAIGATGFLGVGALGIGTKGPIRYTEAATVVECGDFELDIEWVETYDRGDERFIEDSTEDDGLSDQPSINLGDVKPEDSGTACFRIELVVNDDANNVTVEPELSFSNYESAENDINEPENEAGDSSTGDGELEDFLYVELWKDEGVGGIDAFGGKNCERDMFEDSDIAEGWFSDVVQNEKTSIGTLGGDGEAIALAFSWEFRRVGKHHDRVNVTQSDSVTFAFDIEATCPS